MAGWSGGRAALNRVLLTAGAVLLEFVDGIKCVCGAIILCTGMGIWIADNSSLDDGLTGSACAIVCWICGCNEGVEDECLESTQDGKGQEEEFWAGVYSPGWIVRWVAFTCDIPQVERVRLCRIVDKSENLSENQVDCPVFASTISPAFNDSLVVSIYSEVLF